MLGGGQPSPALKVLFRSIVCTVNVGVCMEIVRMFLTVPMVTVPIAASVPTIAVMERFAVDVLQLCFLLPPQAEPGQGEEPEVEGGGGTVPPVGQGPDQWQRVHGPVKAQRVRAEEEPKVHSRQVEESQGPGEERGRVGRWVVGVGEVGGFVAHPVEAAGQEDHSPERQQGQVQQQLQMFSLEDKKIYVKQLRNE